jgi:5-formyltetrahydrofolate cyclo-ligase
VPVESRGKAELRRSLLAARARTDPSALARAASDLCRQVLAAGPVRAARSIAAYVPVGTEPGSVELLDALRDRVDRVVLPVVVAGSPTLDWAVYAGPDQLRAGPLSLREPVGARLGPDALAEVDVVLAPALAVDRAGRRLGRGGGYYDRALAVVPASTPVAALLYDGELLDLLPDEPHDRRVAAAVTPALGWVPLGGDPGHGRPPVDDRPGHSAP